ncbi:bifunctional hydroxy-methylpyrimidine kinase and hydroxy-phosphomethylpyrimidine kinase [Legionella birminghamensis]|uniref:hydroxymethylpyrimidine kinase n=1 Tax=Legionella birminghamensis TaxID=28083 RepID=A0A378IDN3_9GAMM|nr:bifunctional hydroxymethylpyrimidine kinase/phosphomethylpyrimidine kinase [Legionella birminghamensis]KTC72573.1 bifunctional hydroxy-methylpyrimidine kinase and hydroxy-phosphomethylpyrimidine kinase [Legionella birminghamensis]STX32845.1 bifunctional hydroxy-methylpyrimidine kinase and hydroxy-phosphomethylpyrimidine kinase [Legionella birminghamensis]
MKKIACVLSIAGTDPSGGAGIQADIKTISATGAYAASVITALVAQNTCGVMAIEAVSADFIQQQLKAVFSDMEIAAVKVGMVYSKEAIEVIASWLKAAKQMPVVIDPLMFAKDNSSLMDKRSLSIFKTQLLPLASLITPNIPEAEMLCGKEITCCDDMQEAALAISQHYETNVLLKGGHLPGENSTDILCLHKPKQLFFFRQKRINTNNTHGTGCTLSSAIASFLAQKINLHSAIEQAKRYLTAAIVSGRHLKIGQGNGPVDHFFIQDK